MFLGLWILLSLSLLRELISNACDGDQASIIRGVVDLALEILQVNINTVDETMLNSFTIKDIWREEEMRRILNLSVPMALTLSRILMGGVVIVYGRKVKVLLG